MAGDVLFVTYLRDPTLVISSAAFQEVAVLLTRGCASQDASPPRRGPRRDSGAGGQPGAQL